MHGITKPSRAVLDRIAVSYSNRMAAVVHDADLSMELYEIVKNLPQTSTRIEVQKALNITLDGVLSETRDNLLIACDTITGEALVVKLVRASERTASSSSAELSDAVKREFAVAELVSKEIEFFVKSKEIKVDVEHAEGREKTYLRALAMPRYIGTLSSWPQLEPNVILKGVSRVLQGLRLLHQKGYVHMDVKSGKLFFPYLFFCKLRHSVIDNVMIDSSGTWFLGDFGSAVAIGQPIWTHTDVFMPKRVRAGTTAQPFMDEYLLCVMVAFESECKQRWKERLCGDQQRVQESLVALCLGSIPLPDLRELAVPLFNVARAELSKHLAL